MGPSCFRDYGGFGERGEGEGGVKGGGRGELPLVHGSGN